MKKFFMALKITYFDITAIQFDALFKACRKLFYAREQWPNLKKRGQNAKNKVLNCGI